MIVTSAHLYVGERCARVVAQTAHLLASVTVVVAVTAVRRVEAEVATLLGRVHLLVHAVYGLEDATRQLLELAQLDRLLYTVVL